AAGAIERGYGHTVITDHSHSLFITNGLNEAALAAQWREMEAVRATLPGGFELLQGTEMEILPDGSLDFSDAVLRRLDWVVASIHTKQRQSADEINARIEIAMRNPYVDCIGHPTCRLLLRRPKTALDSDRLIALAAETGTFLEINASPDRLDLDAETAERAAAAGVLLCIDSDAHGPNTFGLVEHGVAIARRAGLTAEQVLNTREWSAIRDMQKRWR
ncbi:MAG: PHP-like protein, partial [Thermoleophilia bacterium]|nr:PHP-like protein [Thermoleophilia bacterium]